MLKKTFSMLIIFLLMNSIATVAGIRVIGGQIDTYSVEKKINVNFTLPTVEQKQGYDWLTLENCSYITTPGYPMLPVKTVTVELPEGSKITQVKVTSTKTTIEGNFNVLPVSTPVTSNSQNTSLSPNPEIYNSNELFPKESYVYHEGQGLSSEAPNRVKYVILNLFPLQYFPENMTIILIEEMIITIQYIPEIRALTTSLTTLQNLIIVSPTLQVYAESLASWKNQTGVTSKVINTTTIYQQYPGLDNPERIRNCIKDYVSLYGITYTTIFGDTDQVPIRYVFVNDTEASEYTVPTDLYYADLTGSWDDNHDGVYGDQEYDSIDGIPDVYVGRLPVSSTTYAQIVVYKIIGYEQQVIYNPSPNDWTQRFILAAGTGSGDGFSNRNPDGNTVLNDYIGNLMEGKNVTKLYEKYDALSTASMTAQLNKGALFLNFAGHGDPGAGLLSVGWLFYWVIPGLIWNGYGISDAQSLTNGYKLPVVTAMSCSTARLDDTDCLGEWFVCSPNGGSIAYIGCTRIAWSYVDDYAPYGLMGAMDRMIYETYNQGQTRTGELWGESVKNYYQSYIYNYHYAYVHDVKTLMETILIGDPTIDVSGDFTPPITNCTYDGQWHNADFSPNLSATDFGKGVMETYYRVNNGSLKTLSIDGQPYITLEGTNNRLEYWSVDKAGKSERHNTITDIKLDKTPPTGTIAINNGALYTKTCDVTIDLTSYDEISGVSQIRLTNDVISEAQAWQSPVSTQAWTLTPTDGTKTVYYQIKDMAGFISTYACTIGLDTTSPEGSITINGGASYTNITTLSLLLSASDAVSGLNRMRLSNDSITWTSWEPYTAAKSCSIPLEEGSRNVYVQYQDNVGLTSTFVSSIYLDLTKPVANPGQNQTINVGSSVTLNALSSTDNVGIAKYYWVFDDNSTGTQAVTTHTYSSPGTYTATLYVYDLAGNSDSASITIVVQQQPTPTPTATPTSPNTPNPTPSSTSSSTVITPSPTTKSSPTPAVPEFQITVLLAIILLSATILLLTQRRMSRGICCRY